MSAEIANKTQVNFINTFSKDEAFHVSFINCLNYENFIHDVFLLDGHALEEQALHHSTMRALPVPACLINGELCVVGALSPAKQIFLPRNGAGALSLAELVCILNKHIPRYFVTEDKILECSVTFG